MPVAAVMREDIEHARQGFEDLADLYCLPRILTEARVEATDYPDRQGRPLYAVVVESLAVTFPDAARLAAKLMLIRAETALTTGSGLVCWIGWLRQASQYDPVAVRLYAPTAADNAPPAGPATTP